MVRLQADGSATVSRWLHTPNRLVCVDPLTGEPTGWEAQPRETSAGVAA
ncbi:MULTISPECIES: hypothetical protein [unclassified Micromonospora]